jgi:hypothetical protein
MLTSVCHVAEVLRLEQPKAQAWPGQLGKVALGSLAGMTLETASVASAAFVGLDALVCSLQTS